MIKLSRVCPICNCSTGSLLHNQQFTLPNNSILPTSYNVVSCSQCGFCYADTKASQDDYDIYYNHMSKYEDKETASGGALDEIDKRRLMKAAQIISNNCANKNLSILDIGCANGGLLNCLKELGYKNLTGIDITQICVNNVKQLGINAYFGGIFNLENIRDIKFDVVILSHVLEHVRDLKNAVKNLKNLLNEDGFLYIEVPDASRYEQYFVVPYYYFDCEHINHFDSDALKNLFEDFETTCISIDEREILVSETTPYPSVSLVFKKTGIASVFTIKPSFKAKDSINKYVILSKQNTDYSMLTKVIKDGCEVFVWGAGMYTLRLLQNSPLRKCNIISFLDKDSKKQGNKINDIIIQEPKMALTQNKETIVIVASALHVNEIVKEIRMIDNNFNRRVVTL